MLIKMKLLLTNLLIVFCQQSFKNDEAIKTCVQIKIKMFENQENIINFNDTSKKFSDKIGHDIEQTKNFVDLLMLSNCLKKIKLHPKFILDSNLIDFVDLFDIKNLFDIYDKFDNDEKKMLIKDFDQIKEILNGNFDIKILNKKSHLVEKTKLVLDSTNIGTGQTLRKFRKKCIKFLFIFFRFLHKYIFILGIFLLFIFLSKYF